MTENFLFKAMVISLAAHTAILWWAYFSRVHDSRYQSMRQNRMEISYKPDYRKPADIHDYPIKLAQHLDFASDPKLFSNGTIPVSLVKNASALPFGMSYERGPEHMRTMELSRRISITPIKSEKINNPVYAAYNEMVRDRIKERVYANYDKMEAGVVYLTFLVNKDGDLVAAKIIPEKTDASEHLQDIAFRSLKEASPFPPFLRGMNLTEYPFNIEIQYQISD